MSGIITPSSVTIRPDPRDRGSRYTVLWLAWIAAFGVLEYRAIRADQIHGDKVKRTLSSNLRWWAATDSVTGIALDAKYGKLRRLALITALAWFGTHIQRNGVV